MMILKSQVLPIKIQLGPIAHGVLNCVISNSYELVGMSSSYLLGDAIKDLVKAVIALLLHEDALVWCHWSNETFFYSWVMKHEQQELSIIICHDDSPIRAENFALATILLQTRCRFDDFLSQIYDAYQRLLHDYGVMGYYERWGKHFPQGEFDQFCAAIQHYYPRVAQTTNLPHVSPWAFLRDAPQTPIEEHERDVAQVDSDAVDLRTVEQLLLSLYKPVNQYAKKYLMHALQQKSMNLLQNYLKELNFRCSMMIFYRFSSGYSVRVAIKGSCHY